MAQRQAKTDDEPEVVKAFPLKPSNFQLVQYTNNIHNAMVPSNTTPEMVADPHFWMNVAKSIKTYDEIRVIHEDNAFYMLLLVTFSDGANIVVKPLIERELDGPIETLGGLENYDVVNRGGQKNWCVVRKEDGHEIKTGLSSQGAALKELAGYLMTIKQG